VARKVTSMYLDSVKGEGRRALDKLRKTIRTIVPKAEECISYGIPTFRCLVWIGGCFRGSGNQSTGIVETMAFADVGR